MIDRAAHRAATIEAHVHHPRSSGAVLVSTARPALPSHRITHRCRARLIATAVVVGTTRSASAEDAEIEIPGAAGTLVVVVTGTAATFARVADRRIGALRATV